MKYEVSVVRSGCIYVEANSPEEAMAIAERQPASSAFWSENMDVDGCDAATACGEDK